METRKPGLVDGARVLRRDHPDVVVEVPVPAGVMSRTWQGAVADRGEGLRGGEAGQRPGLGQPRRRDALDRAVELDDGDVVAVAGAAR